MEPASAGRTPEHQRRNVITELNQAIDNAWLGKVELDLDTATELLADLVALKLIVSTARRFQLASGTPLADEAATDLTELLDARFGGSVGR
jgi:hypothetical protein